jgi:hypothetical protein
MTGSVTDEKGARSFPSIVILNSAKTPARLRGRARKASGEQEIVTLDKAAGRLLLVGEGYDTYDCLLLAEERDALRCRCGGRRTGTDRLQDLRSPPSP